jgi:hypothetical protein
MSDGSNQATRINATPTFRCFHTKKAAKHMEIAAVMFTTSGIHVAGSLVISGMLTASAPKMLRIPTAAQSPAATFSGSGTSGAVSVDGSVGAVIRMIEGQVTT